MRNKEIEKSGFLISIFSIILSFSIFFLSFSANSIGFSLKRGEEIREIFVA